MYTNNCMIIYSKREKLHIYSLLWIFYVSDLAVTDHGQNQLVIPAVYYVCPFLIVFIVIAQHKVNQSYLAMLIAVSIQANGLNIHVVFHWLNKVTHFV